MHNVHLGTLGWSYNFWKGSFYPPKTPAKDFLSYYASRFNTVEVDSTFYRLPTEQTVLNWKQQTPPQFLFSFKFPARITHIKRLRDCQTDTATFLERILKLGEKVGALLLQFPPNFGVDHLPDLKNYLQGLPKHHRYAVEVRNKTWLTAEFYDVLKANRVALAWSDRNLMGFIRELTADFLYIRWEGDRKKVNGTLGKIEEDRSVDLKLEAEKVKPYIEKVPFFGYFGKYYSGLPPSDIVKLQQYLAENQ